MFTTPFTFLKAAGGGAWTPADLPGIENWFKADTGITIVSSKVTTWQDSLTSKTVSQSTSASRPTFTASNSDFNNLPTVDFDNNSGTPVFLFNNSDFSYSGTLPIYCFVIARKTVSQGFASAGGGSDETIGGGAWSVNITDTGVRPWTATIAGGYLTEVTGTTLNTTLLAGLGIISTNAYAYLNNSSAATPGSYTGAANPRFLIGGYDTTNTAYNLTGSVAELIITRGTELSGTDLSNLWDYVQTKYGI